MAFCRKCGNEMGEQAIRCSECGEVHIQKAPPTDDKGSFVHVLIGLCVPIVGIILFVVWNKDRPKSAKNALIGSLLVIPLYLIMAIISAFAIPALGQIINNTNADIVLADALAVEYATELYCFEAGCEYGTDIKYSDISSYIENLDESYYELGPNTDVAYYAMDGIHVHLEAKGTGQLEFREGTIPSQSTREDVIEDTN